MILLNDLQDVLIQPVRQNPSKFSLGLAINLIGMPSLPLKVKSFSLGGTNFSVKVKLIGVGVLGAASQKLKKKA